MKMRDIIMENEDSKNVTINIPITITIPAGGGMPSVGTIAAPADPTDLPDESIMVPPLQQELELLKQQGGKKSKIINQIISDNGAGGKMSDASEASQEYSKRNYYNLAEDYEELANQFDRSVEPKE
jgi:hypothetical protein